MEGSGGDGPATTLPGELSKRYRVTAFLGRGGFGQVIRAEDAELGRPVAIKLLDLARAGRDEALERFVREATATASIRHPHVVQVYDHGIDPRGGAWIIYELIEGTSLERFGIGGSEVAGPERAVAWGVALARALQAVHERGILHRDVKPANLMLRADGSPVLCDFGLAKGGEELATLTRTGQVMGTPMYMASEVWRGELPTAAADQYALGMVLFELLYRTREPWGTTFDAVLQTALEARRPYVPAGMRERFPALEPVLLRALDPRPAGRYPSMGELAEALETLGRGRSARPETQPGARSGPAPALVSRPAPRPPPPPAPGRRIVPLGTALVLLAGGLGILATLRPGRSDAGRAGMGVDPRAGESLPSLRSRLGLAREALLPGHPVWPPALETGTLRSQRAHARQTLNSTGAFDRPSQWRELLELAEQGLRSGAVDERGAALEGLEETAVHFLRDLDMLRTEVKNSFNALFERPSIPTAELPGLQERISRIERETIGFCDRIDGPLAPEAGDDHGRILAVAGLLRGLAEDTRDGPDCLLRIQAAAVEGTRPEIRLALLRAEETLFNPALEKMIEARDRVRILASRVSRMDSCRPALGPAERRYLECRLAVQWARALRECPGAVSEADLATLQGLLERLESGSGFDPDPLETELGTALRVLENPAGLSYRMLEPRFGPIQERMAKLRERARTRGPDRGPGGP